MDVKIYENLFKEEFLKNAPLYVAAKKVKLPIEDIKAETLLYRGSLHEESRTVELISDYTTCPGNFYDWVFPAVKKLAAQAGIVVDGLIRKENSRTRTGNDPRQVQGLVVTDVFEHEDGRRNLQPVIAKNAPVQAHDPSEDQGWVAYRFYFACAAIRQEYKEKV